MICNKNLREESNIESLLMRYMSKIIMQDNGKLKMKSNDSIHPEALSLDTDDSDIQKLLTGKTIHEAAKDLPLKQKKILYLRYVESITGSKIAENLCIMLQVVNKMGMLGIRCIPNHTGPSEISDNKQDYKKDIMSRAASIEKELDLKGRKGINIYHNARLLLQLYGKVLWRIDHSLDEMEAECLELNNVHLLEAVDSLLGMDTGLDRLNLESRLEDMGTSKEILKLVDRALARLKTYPENGERYFDILNKLYITKDRYSEDRILEHLSISRTTFYKEKKEAIHMLGVILWGFILPEVCTKSVHKTN